ncbi:MAG: hypothetical protein M1828_001711 [Chrysothrix sp. TS-e1954]|nr:MAG: hypothetical protein M1828_001711 [Chrysothrix sp. TS-e1954]
MAYNPSVVPASKLSNVAGQSSSPASSQAGLLPGADHSQRRSGGSGSFGAGATTRASGGAPRNKQVSKNQHKHSRRYWFADEDAIAESAAMSSTRNRKGQTSITHLMNFSLPPRPTQSHPQYHRHARRNPTWGLGSGYHATDKARYVHANYRFIVDPRRDYHAQSIDADLYLDWSSILQVLASPVSQAAACPICLGDPVAPRMAKCGHIFCLHCLIRFMHSSDDNEPIPEKRARSKACPLCWDSIYMSETRPVRWYEGQEGQPPREGADIVLRLVVRSAGKTLALPKESAGVVRSEEDIPWHFAADVMDFARVMRGTEDYMVAQYEDELSQLKQVEKHDELMYGEDTEWTTKARRAVNEAKERVRGIGQAPRAHRRPEDPKSGRTNPNIDSGNRATSTTSPESEAIQLSSKFPGNATSKAELSKISDVSALTTSLADFRASQGQSQPPSDYYFYHALLHYYLSSLDIRILKAAFGDFAAFPSTILPRVERISTGHVVDDELRKRTKYLAHLPHGCELCFLECDWTDTVSAEILDKFKPEIERRRKKNLEKETREEKERARAEKMEDDKRWAAARRKRPSSADRKLQPEDFAPLGFADGVGSVESGNIDEESTSLPFPSSRANGSSFATLASPSTSPSTSRTVWGTNAIAPTSPLMQAVPQDLPPVDDGWLQGWEKDLLQEDQLVTETQAVSLGEPSSGPSSAARKKKGKKITLMSTNARRGA